MNTSYTYTDQNNNAFFISSEMLTYDPISPSESSSGTYSGGEKKNVKISEEDFQLISKKAEQLLESARKSSRREMLTSVLYKKSPKASTKIILSRSSLRTEFEQLLLTFLK